MLKLLRCDDRLIHGQCVTKLISHYEVKDIIVIDNFTASNAMLCKIFASAVPKGIDCKVVTVDNAKTLLPEAMENDKNTIVLMKTPDIMYELYQSVEGLPKEYNIASVPSAAGRKAITNFTYLDEKQAAAVKGMVDMGVHIWFQLIPDSQLYEWDDVKDKF